MYPNPKEFTDDDFMDFHISDCALNQIAMWGKLQPPGPSELLMACLIEQDMRDEDLGILSMMHGANITKSKVPGTFHMSTIALFFVEGQTEVCLQSMLLE